MINFNLTWIIIIYFKMDGDKSKSTNESNASFRFTYSLDNAPAA